MPVVIADETRETIAAAVWRRLYRPHRRVGNALWWLACASRWTHFWYPDWHDAGCPGRLGQPCNHAYCRVDIHERTQQMTPEGRIYRRVHLAVWLAGTRWYFFWLHKHYGWLALLTRLECAIAPSLEREDY